jgi:probable F420-dependent oxidoreductase
VHTLAAYMAGRTETLRFCFYAAVIPYRNTILQASQTITLDQVSNGRVTIVTGIGWLEEEFDALGVPFRGRGARTDEQIRAMRALWTEAEPEFHGQYVDFDKVVMEPKCVQQPHVPIWVGGIGKHARRRIVEYGDGWGAPIPWPMDRLGAEVVRIKRDVAAAGRDPESLSFAAGLTFGEIDADVRELAAHVGAAAEGSAYAATTEEAIELVGRYAEMGFTDLVVNTNWTAPTDFSEKLGAFSADVMRYF